HQRRHCTGEPAVPGGGDPVAGGSCDRWAGGGVPVGARRGGDVEQPVPPLGTHEAPAAARPVAPAAPRAAESVPPPPAPQVAIRGELLHHDWLVRRLAHPSAILRGAGVVHLEGDRPEAPRTRNKPGDNPRAVILASGDYQPPDSESKRIWEPPM